MFHGCCLRYQALGCMLATGQRGRGGAAPSLANSMNAHPRPACHRLWRGGSVHRVGLSVAAWEGLERLRGLEWTI